MAMQKARDDNDMIHITAPQLSVLLNRNIIAYPESETKTAEWVPENRRRSGSTTDVLRGLYLYFTCG